MDKVVLVGSGVSTGIPVIGHLTTDCACIPAMTSAANKNRRNNVSMLIRRFRGTEGEDDAGKGTSTSTRLQPKAPENEGSRKKTQSTLDKEGSVEEKKEGEDEKEDQYERKKRDPNPTFSNILIDAGKTFREAYFTVMAPLGVDTITSLLITHDHADAMAGLDDVRDLQYFTVLDKEYRCDYYIPTYMSPKTYEVLNAQAAYITNNGFHRGHHAATGSSSPEQEADWALQRQKMLQRRSTCLEVYELSDQVAEPVSVQGLEGVPFYTFPVFHGGTYRSMGYAFGSGLRFKDGTEAPCETSSTGSAAGRRSGGGSCIVYISDVSDLPAESLTFLQNIVQIDILVLDLLQGPNRTQFAHFCMDQFLQLVWRLQPTKAYGVGMYCDLEHDATNVFLAAELKAYKEKHSNLKCKVETLECGFDGQSFDVTL